jgi:hypothetical protein
MERHWKRATRWAAVGARAEAALGAIEPLPAFSGRDGGMVRKGAAAGGPPWSASAGWEVRAASFVGAAMVHWLSTGGDRATTKKG